MYALMFYVCQLIGVTSGTAVEEPSVKNASPILQSMREGRTKIWDQHSELKDVDRTSCSVDSKP